MVRVAANRGPRGSIPAARAGRAVEIVDMALLTTDGAGEETVRKVY